MISKGAGGTQRSSKRLYDNERGVSEGSDLDARVSLGRLSSSGGKHKGMDEARTQVPRLRHPVGRGQSATVKTEMPARVIWFLSSSCLYRFVSS